MFRTLFFFLNCTLLCITCFSQTSFIKKISHEESVTGAQIVSNNGRIFLQASAVCNNQSPCTIVMEVDLDGEIIWKKTLDWLDASSNSMIVEDSLIMISGNPSFISNHWLWHQMSIDGGDSISTSMIYDSLSIYAKQFNLGSIKLGEKYVVYGKGRLDNKESSLFYYINNIGKVDTLVEVFTSIQSSDPWDSVLDSEGNLTSFIRYEEDGKENQRAIVKISPEYEVVWNYISEEDDLNHAVPNGTILHNGLKVYNVSEGWNAYVENLRAIDENGDIAWKYESPYTSWYARVFYEIKTLKNGSIIAVGLWADKQGSPSIDNTPWIVNISEQGELLWEKTFYEVSEESGEAKFSFFFDVEELEDGTLMAIGTTQESIFAKREILLARLDSTGCHIPDCPVKNDISELFTGNNPLKPTSIQLSPNPVIDFLTIDTDERINRLEIYSLNGQNISSHENTLMLDLSLLDSGIYILKVVSMNYTAIHMFVKQ